MSKCKFHTCFLISAILLASCSNKENPVSGRVGSSIDYLNKPTDTTKVIITNPAIPGFNPDPCIIRVENDYYIATSSFEWFPGIPLYHSKDLANWEPIGHILTRESQADLRGIGSSSGIYAPSLHHHKGKYYALYTIVSGDFFPHLATPNYIVWADSITGPWSEPVYINSTGFDPSLFFDEDGTCYYLNMLLDFNSEHVTGGISMQTFDLSTMSVTSAPEIIFPGTMFGTEGPRIYKREGYYYLFTAEGGTDWNHQVTVCRSTSIWGPYEVDPDNPLITSRDHPDHPLQRAGHASMVQSPEGEWYMAYLASRPVMPQRMSVLGRESCIQKIDWSGEWPVLEGGGDLPHLFTEGVGEKGPVVARPLQEDQFESEQLQPIYQTLRQPFDPSWMSLTMRSGYLALKGRKPFTSRDDQSLVARRITSLHGRVETALDYEPLHYRNLAGLIIMYDIRDFIYLHVSYDHAVGKYLSILHHSSQGISEPCERVPIPRDSTIFLGLEIDNDTLQFSYSRDGVGWTPIGDPFDFCQLSDENNRYGFTGSMVGICSQDMVDESLWAYFDYFKYVPE